MTNPAYDLHLHNAFHWQTHGNLQYPMVRRPDGSWACHPPPRATMLLQCYAGMTAAAWRFLLAPFGGPSATADSVIDAFAAELNQGDWYLDQHGEC